MDNHQAIRDMINNISMGNASEVQTNFNAIMQARAGDALNDYRQTLARSVFKNPEMQAMGLADGEEHIIDVDNQYETEE